MAPVTMKRSGSALADAGAVAALVLLTILLYRKVLALWLMYDDANILRTTYDFPFLDIFRNAKVWPQQLFTPMLPVAFHAMRRLFGFDPSRFYVMQIAIATITIVLVYAAVRQFLDWKRSLAAAALFAAGPPICSVVTQLSTIHYFIAIAFCAAAVIAYAAALRRPSVAVERSGHPIAVTADRVAAARRTDARAIRDRPRCRRHRLLPLAIRGPRHVPRRIRLADRCGGVAAAADAAAVAHHGRRGRRRTRDRPRSHRSDDAHDCVRDPRAILGNAAAGCNCRGRSAAAAVGERSESPLRRRAVAGVVGRIRGGDHAAR
jgi:hypothetical protein